MKEKRQRSLSFKDWYIFELLPQHLGYEALQTYEHWTEEYTVQLCEAERFSEARVELIAAVKEGAIASFISTIKEEEQPRDGGNSCCKDTT